MTFRERFRAFAGRLWQAIRESIRPTFEVAQRLKLGVPRAALVTGLAHLFAAYLAIGPDQALTLADIVLNVVIAFIGYVWVNYERATKPTPIVTVLAAHKAEQMIADGKLEQSTIVTYTPPEDPHATPKP